MLETPVLFLIFNRIDTTRQVFAQIRQAQPKQLFIAADGPRLDKAGEEEKCEQVRKTVLEGIDWECEVKTLFRSQNLGCGKGPANAITWFFTEVEQGIILEDDCLPHPTFFSFCQTLLEYYKYEEKVMLISGNNFQNGKKRGDGSYYFSHYPHTWGWATWRRAWKHFDYEIKDFAQFKAQKRIQNILDTKVEQAHWLREFETVGGGQRNDVWDYQWAFSIWNNNGVALTPNRNLVSNIGFSNEATHTIQLSSPIAALATKGIDSLSHPKRLIISKKADAHTFSYVFNPPTSIMNRFRNVAYRHIPPQIYDKAKHVKKKLSKII